MRSGLFFSVLLRCFSIEFCQNFFCLRLEVPSRDLNGDGGNWPHWIRICHFYSPNTYPSKLLRGDMLNINWYEIDMQKWMPKWIKNFMKLFSKPRTVLPKWNPFIKRSVISITRWIPCLFSDRQIKLSCPSSPHICLTRAHAVYENMCHVHCKRHMAERTGTTSIKYVNHK